MASPGNTERTTAIPTLSSLVPSTDTGIVTTTNVTSPWNSTVIDMTSAMNVTTGDVIAPQNVTTTSKYDLTSSVNVTSFGDVISTLNVTTGDFLATANDTLFNSTPVTSREYLSSTNMTTFPTWIVTSNDSYINLTTDAPALEEVIEQRIADSINFWIPPFLFFIGVVANILVVMVMQSKDFRHMSTSFYMSVSSVVDIASLIVSLPAHYLYVNFPQIFDTVRDAHPMCSFFNLFGWGSSDMGVLLTVAMTTERSLAIQFPLKAPTLCTVKRAKIVSFCLFLLEILKVGHLVFTSRVASKDVTAYLCDVDLSDSTYAIFYTQYWPYIHNVFLVVAFTVIIIGNVIITVHVKRSEDMGEMSKTAGGVKGGKLTSKSRQLSLMLIVDSATIVICTLPFSLFLVIDQAFTLFPEGPKGHGQSSLTFAIVFYLLYVNRCANFFLYCISGARFRQTLKDILTGTSLTKKNYITGATNTRNVTSSSLVTTEGEGDRVSMNPMGSSAQTSAAEKAKDGPSGKRVSLNPNGPSSAPPLPAQGGSSGSKLERHYGYGKTANGK